MREIGAGLTTFAPGRDAGRDGYFEGSAPYPSKSSKWNGVWYIQAKYYTPSLSPNPQQWLLTQVRKELAAFAKPDSARNWPDNWIIITNVDPTAVAKRGSFDQSREDVRAARPSLVSRFHIWGGDKVLDLLSRHKDVASRYGDFLTPGHLVSAVVKSYQARIERTVHSLLVRGMDDQRYAKLEQAGSQQFRLGIHHLFTDVPFHCREQGVTENAIAGMHVTSRKSHRPDADFPRSTQWLNWRRHPSRARIWFVRGGPGQGKSTIAQYFAQVQRAWFVLEGNIRVDEKQRQLAEEIRTSAKKLAVWPLQGRIPVVVELNDYAQWFSEQQARGAKGVLSYLSRVWSNRVEDSIDAGTIREMMADNRWFIVFDGLDEVPADVKEAVAAEVTLFLRNVVVEAEADVFAFCTSRPQGYAGQFDELDACAIDLVPLTTEQAVECAKPVLALQQNVQEANRDIERLRKAARRPGVRELMVTPLQAHIMAIVVRGGARPPDRRWKLFHNFYETIPKREATRDLSDENLSRVLRDEELLLKTVHNRVGFQLHALAETSAGAQATLDKQLFARIVRAAVGEIKQREIDITVKTLINATTERLVLVNTPDDGHHVRFDVRQLQEFFAAEFLYDSIHVDALSQRVELIAGDSHWREVTQFLVSGLIESNRQTELEITANALQRIDNDPTDGLRAVRRRLARGAMVTAKLLAEGVLEQDLRMREHLRHTLDAAFASTERAIIEPLLQVAPPNSSDWLIDTALVAFREKQPAESIGAAILLTRKVGNDDPRRNVLIEAFEHADPEYLALIARSRTWTDMQFAPWFYRILGRALCRASALKLSAHGLQAIVEELPRNRKAWSDEELGLSREQSLLLQWLLYVDPGPDLAMYRFGTPLYRASDWTTANVPTELAGIAPTDGPGVLGLLFRIAAFSRMKRKTELRALLRAIEPHIPFAAALPGHVRAHIPIDFTNDVPSQIEILRRLADHDVVTFLTTRRAGGRTWPRPARFGTAQGQLLNAQEWQTLVEESPQQAFRLWRTVDLAGVNKDRADEVLLTKLLHDPFALLSAPGRWGELVTATSHGPRLRAHIRQIAPGFLPRNIRSRVSPFRLQLPEETALLPHLLDALFLNHSELGNKRFVKELAAIDELRRSRDDETLDGTVRIAACVLAWMHPEGDGLAEDASALSFLSSPQCQHVVAWWVVRAFDDLSVQPTRSYIWPVLCRILDHLRDRFRDRDLFDKLLAHWREQSLAPVTTERCADTWLKLA